MPGHSRDRRIGRQKGRARKCALHQRSLVAGWEVDLSQLASGKPLPHLEATIFRRAARAVDVRPNRRGRYSAYNGWSVVDYVCGAPPASGFDSSSKCRPPGFSRRLRLFAVFLAGRPADLLPNLERRDFAFFGGERVARSDVGYIHHTNAGDFCDISFRMKTVRRHVRQQLTRR